jgi:hypothetical protein
LVHDVTWRSPNQTLKLTRGASEIRSNVEIICNTEGDSAAARMPPTTSIDTFTPPAVRLAVFLGFVTNDVILVDIDWLVRGAKNGGANQNGTVRHPGRRGFAGLG